MVNFTYIRDTAKAEQVRAWAVEQAVESFDGMAMTDEQLIRRAAKIEDYVLNGEKEKGNG